MKNLQNRLMEKISGNKITKRCLALLLALSMTVSFVIPYEDAFESAITTAIAAGQEDQAGNIITEAYDDAPDGAVNFGDVITGFDIVNSNDNTINGGSADKATSTLKLSYNFSAGSGINENQRYIYYQLPKGITVREAFQGDKCKVTDGIWEPSNIDNPTRDTAGYYSISTDGLIVIKFTKYYVQDKIDKNNGAFSGNISFEGQIGRNNTASGDREVVINDHKITVTFDDVIKENSKNSEIKEDANGDMIIHYTINVKNPAKNVDFTQYNFTDSLINSANASKISNVISNPNGCISYDNNGNITFTDSAKDKTSFTIEYDYKPTIEEILSGKINNDAHIINKDNPSDKADTSKETDITHDDIKANIVKNGEPSYTKYGDDELGYIEWTINVTRNYHLSLKDYVITDDAFNGAVTSGDNTDNKTKIISVKDNKNNAEMTDNDYSVSDNKLTINKDTDDVTITYRTYVDNNGGLLRGNTETANVSNTVKVTPLNSETPDDESTTDVTYSESSSVSKSGTNKQINGYDSLNKPESEETELEWEVNISDFSGIHINKPYEDTLGDNQWFTDEQIRTIQIKDKNGNSFESFTVEPTGTAPKYTGFKINFKSNNADIKGLTITYQSTADVEDLANNSNTTFLNKGTYDNNESIGEITVTRGNDTFNSGSKSFQVNKTWEGFPNDDTKQNDIWIKLQYRLEDESEWKDYPVINGITANPSKLQTNSGWQAAQWGNLYQKDKDGKTYYYRVVEVILDENGNYRDVDGSDNFYPSYSVPNYVEDSSSFNQNTGYNSTKSNDRFEVTNTYNKFNATINKTWLNAPEGEKPKITFTLLKKVGESGQWIDTGKTQTLSNGATSVTFEGLPKLENGETVYYKVEEIHVNNYTTTYPTEFISKDNQNWTITNSYEKMEINAVKNWVGDAGSESKRNDLQIKFTLQYTIDENPTEDSSWADIPVEWGTAEKTLTGSADKNSQVCTWNELPRKNSEGKTIHYRVRETKPDNSEYITEYKTEIVTPSDKYDVDYIINNVWQKVNITPQKKWVGDVPSNRSDITVKLQYKEGLNGEWKDHTESDNNIIKNASDITINVDKTTNVDNIDTATSSWKELPKEVNGVEYYYRAVETNILSGYIETYDETGLNQTGNSVITNTLNTIEITPAKKWVGDKNHTEDRGESVKLKLQWKYEGETTWNDTDDNHEPVGKKDFITINSQENTDTWTTSEKWSNLPKTYTTDSGERKNIEYQVVEVETNENYTASASEITEVSNTLTVTNTYKFFDITASKVWEKDTESDRPETITVHLEKSTDNGTNWEKVADSEKEINIKGGESSASWIKLQKENNIIYRVVETPVEGYGITYSPATTGSTSSEFTITNTKKSSYGKVAIDPTVEVKDGTLSSTLTGKEISKITNLKNIPKTSDGYYIFTWKVNVPKGEYTKYIDTLPAGSTFDTGTGSDYILVDYGSNIYKNAGGNNVSCTKNSDGTITFDYKSANNVVAIIYFTKVPVAIVDNAVNTTGYYELKNSIKREGDTKGVDATLTIGSKPVAPGEKGNITKSYDTRYDNDKMNVYARYIVEINPDGKKLSSEDYLDVSDIFKVTGYKTPPIYRKDENGNNIIAQEGTMHTGTGLLDATIDSIVVEDMGNLDADGNPVKITDYIHYPPETKKENEFVELDKTDYVNSITCGGDSWINIGFKKDIPAESQIVIEVEGEAGEEITITMPSWYDASGEFSVEIIDKKYDENGKAKLKIIRKNCSELGKSIQFKVSNSKSVTILGFGKDQEIIGNLNSFQVPDEKHLRITYYYSLRVNDKTPGDNPTIGDKPPIGAEVFFQNEASLNTSDGKETASTDENSFEVQSSSADVTTGNIPSIEKVDIGNYAHNPEAEFKLAKYDKTSKKWIYATGFTKNNNNNIEVTYAPEGTDANTIPTNAASLTVSTSQQIILESGKLYKVVEVSSPAGYVQTPYTDGMDITSPQMKDFVFYFVYNGNPSEFADVAGASGKIMNISSTGKIDIPNTNLIDVSVSKTWAQIPENSVLTATFKLYYSEKRSSTIPTGNDLKEVSGLGIENAEKTAKFDNSAVQIDEIKWTDLPNGKGNKPIYYYVQETSYTIDGKTYKLQDNGTYKTDNNEVGEYKSLYSGNALNQTGEVKYTNTKGLYVKKEWLNSDNTPMANAPVDSIKFKLQGKTTADGEWQDIELSDNERTLSKENHWEILIAANKLADYVDFKVTEDLTSDQSVQLYGYVVSYTKNLSGQSGVLEISNKNPHATKIDFTVKKEWSDGSSGHDGIEVKLYQSTIAWAGYTPTDAEKASSTKIGETVVLNNDNDWSHTWFELDNLNTNGKLYYYYAVEESVPNGYTATYSKNGAGSVWIETITNTPEEVPGKLSVQKKWEKVSESNQEAITLGLYRRKKALTTDEYDIPADITVACVGDSITENTFGDVPADKTYPATLGELLKKYTNNQNKVVNHGHNGYKIENLDTDSNIKFDWETQAKIICLIIGTNNFLNADDTVDTVTSKLKTYIEAIKKEDNIIFVGSIPDVKYGSMITDNNKISKFNTDAALYNTAIENLIKNELKNNDIKFVDINEVLTDDLISNDGIHPNPNGCAKIAETFYNEIGNYYGKKSAVDTSDVQVDINYVPTDFTDEEKFQTITLNKENNWRETLTGLGTTVTENDITYQYIYYVKEETTGNSWEVSYQHNGQPANGQMAITVTNTGSEEAKKYPVKVTKVWKNSDDTDADTYPDSVEVQLCSAKSENGTYSPVGEKVTLNAGNNWTHTWENVCEEGLWYKVDETKVNGWAGKSTIVQITSASTVETPAEITLTNTLEYGDLQIEKSWLDGKEGANSVDVELYRVAVDENGNPISTEQTTENARTYNFSTGNAMFSLSRVRKAVAELETQSAEQETNAETTAKENKSVDFLSKAKSVVSAKATETYISIPNPERYKKYILNDESLDYYCADKEITRIEAIFDESNGWYNNSFEYGILVNENEQTQYTNGFYNNAKDIVVDGVYVLKEANTGSVVSGSLTYIISKQEYDDSNKMLELRFYYELQGPQISFTKPTGNTAVVGDKITLNPTITGTYDSLTYSITEGADKATVSETGEVTFNGKGTVKITATASQSGVSNNAEITYTVSDFKITENETTSDSRQQIQEDSPEAKLFTNARGEVEWSSSNSNVIAVDNTGTLTINGLGDANITATRKGTNITDTIYYHVNGKGFNLTADKTTLHSGGTTTLTIDGLTNTNDVTWDSSNISVATVSNGVVIAVGNGTTTITASRGGQSATIEITVAPLTIIYDSTEHITALTIEKNINETFDIEFKYVVGTLTPESSDGTIASATVSGNTATITVGKKDNTSTTITFTDEGGGKVSVTVNVKKIAKVEADIPNGSKKVTTVGNNGVITISKSNNWKSEVIKNLPLTDGNGHYYKYYIKEVDNEKYIPISYDNGKELNTTDTTTLKLTNKSNETSGGMELPETGGMGTEPYIAVGLSLMTVSAAIMYIRRKKRKNA